VAWRRAQSLQLSAEMQLDSIEEKRKDDRDKYEEKRRLRLLSGYFKPRYNTDWNPRLKETEAESTHPKVSVIVKGDVDGSVEAILSCLETYTSPDVDLDIVNFGVGQVTESDVTMAQEFNAVLYAFNLNVADNIQKAADTAGVTVRSFNVIYHLIDDLKNELSDKLPPATLEEIVGRGSVLQEFVVSLDRKKVSIAGCRISSGKVQRGAFLKVVRGDDVIYDGNISSLKHHKDEVEEVTNGQECGIRVEDDIHFLPGDQITSYNSRQERRRTDWDPGF